MALTDADAISMQGAKALLAEKRQANPVSEAASVMGKAAAAKRAEQAQQPVPVKDRPAFQAPPADTPEDEDPDNQLVQAGVEDGSDELPEGQELDQDETGDEPTIEIDGQVLTAKEIRDSYLRQADYTRKTTDVSERAKNLDLKEQVLTQRETQAFTKLNDLISTLEQSIGPEPNWIQLAQQVDPREFNVYQQQSKQFKDGIEHAKTPRTQVEMENLQRSKAAMYSELITTYKPEWKDTGKLQMDIGKIAQFAIDIGVTQQELAYLNRAPMFKILDMAHELHTMKQSQTLTDKRVRHLPKPLKPGASRGRQDAANVNLESARKTWEDTRNPSTKDAMQWLNAKKQYEASTGRKA